MRATFPPIFEVPKQHSMWAPVGPSWAPVGPRLGLTGAHLGMLLGLWGPLKGGGGILRTPPPPGSTPENGHTGLKSFCAPPPQS